MASHWDGNIQLLIPWAETAQAVPPFHSTVSDNQFCRVTVLASLSIGCACRAAGDVCAYVCVYSCGCASLCSIHTALLQGGCDYIVILNSLVLAVTQQSDLSVGSLSFRDQTVNLTQCSDDFSDCAKNTANSTTVTLLLEWLECLHCSSN